MRALVWILIASLLASSVSAASFGLYIDNTGGPSDVILATNVMTQAEAQTSALPVTGYDHLFSDYTTPDDLMLVISHGKVWIVADKNANLSAEFALVRTLTAEHVDYNLTRTVPTVLSEAANATTQAANGTSPTTAPTSQTNQPGTNASAVANGSTSNGSCTGTVCSINGSGPANATNQASPPKTASEHTSLIVRILSFLFGWLHR